MRRSSKLLLTTPALGLVVIAACEGGTSNDPPETPKTDAAVVDAAGGTDTGATDAGADVAVDSGGDGGGALCALENGLVGRWTFDENIGTTTADKSPSNNPGALVGPPAWSIDKPPTTSNTSSLTFDGLGTHVEIGNPDVLRIKGTLTLAAWIKTSAPVPNYRTIVSKWWSGGEDAAYSLYWSEPGGIGLTLNSSQNIILRAQSNQALNDNAWHLVVGTWDGMTARIYTDGVQRGADTPDGAFGQLSDITHPVRIGTDDRFAANGGGDRYFAGNIDDVRIYTRALNVEEVGMLFNGVCAKVP